MVISFTVMAWSYESVYDSCSADTEPSMAQMANVINYMKEHHVKYILYEELSTPNVARAIADATGVSVKPSRSFISGRIEIPDGSDSYIKCQMCGTDIRYGRFVLTVWQSLIKKTRQQFM